MFKFSSVIYIPFYEMLIVSFKSTAVDEKKNTIVDKREKLLATVKTSKRKFRQKL